MAKRIGRCATPAKPTVYEEKQSKPRIKLSAKTTVFQLLMTAWHTSGPLLFVLYVADIAGIADRHGIQSHLYTDDAQLYLTCRRSEVTTTTSRLTCCVDQIACWLASNRLMLNPAKTDLLWCTAKGSSPDVSVTPDSVNAWPSTDVCIYWCLIDSTLYLKMHSLSWSAAAAAGTDGSGVSPMEWIELRAQPPIKSTVL